MPKGKNNKNQKQTPNEQPQKQGAQPTAAPTPVTHALLKTFAAVPAVVIDAPASYAGVSIQPKPYDPAAAKAALESLKPRLMAPPREQLVLIRLDIKAAALATLGVHAFVTQVPAVRARFDKLASIGEFDARSIDDLESLALSALLVHGQAEAAGVFHSDAKVPVKLVEAATAVEARMQELLEYKFKRDEKVAPILALLRPGMGHRDLAGDLLGYADLYEQNAAEVASETTNYRATDLADARRMAGEILAHLAATLSPEARALSELLSRVWTLLRDVYFEVRSAGLFLLRHDPAAEERFPSLFAVARPRRAAKKKDAGNAKGGAKKKAGEDEEDSGATGTN